MQTLASTVLTRTSNVTPESPGTWTNTSNPWNIPGGTNTYSNQMVQNSISFPSYGTTTFNGSLYVGGNMTFSSGNVVFNGPVTVVGSLNMSGSGTITFNSTVWAGSIQQSNNNTPIYGGALYVQGNYSFPGGSGNPTFDSTVYVGGNLTTAAGYVLTLPDSLYIKGNLSLSAGSNIITTATTSPQDDIVVNGTSIYLDGGTSLGSNYQPPLIIALNTTTITFDNGADTYAAIYAPSATVNMSGNAQLVGAIIGGTVNMVSGSPGITYNSKLATQSGIPSQGGSSTPSSITWDITNS
jgi:hypothetical protein